MMVAEELQCDWAKVRPQYAAANFFSSRRRHTRCLSDWSSDVCSSDLIDRGGQITLIPALGTKQFVQPDQQADVEDIETDVSPDCHRLHQHPLRSSRSSAAATRSEERRVGKACGTGESTAWSRLRGANT